jgi:hypothetical protein
VRRLLIAALLAAAACGAVQPAGAVPPLASAFGPFTVDPGNADCVPATEPGIGATRLCDPINIIFPGQSLDSVLARLHAAGWSNGSGTVQWLHFDTSTLVPVQWQLGWQDGPDPTQRYHVRLWQVAPDLTVGNVHHEHGTPHQIDLPWDTAEAFLAKPLCSWWCQHLPLDSQAALQGDGDMWRGWPNDAIATVIPAQPPATPPAQAPPQKAKAQPKPKKKHRKHRRAA